MAKRLRRPMAWLLTLVLLMGLLPGTAFAADGAGREYAMKATVTDNDGGGGLGTDGTVYLKTGAKVTLSIGIGPNQTDWDGGELWFLYDSAVYDVSVSFENNTLGGGLDAGFSFATTGLPREGEDFSDLNATEHSIGQPAPVLITADQWRNDYGIDPADPGTMRAAYITFLSKRDALPAEGGIACDVTLTVKAETGAVAPVKVVAATYYTWDNSLNNFVAQGKPAADYTPTSPVNITTMIAGTTTDDQTYTITPPSTVAGAVGVPLTTDAPTLSDSRREGGTWSASGLPTGLTIDPTTGVISGTPTVQGVWTNCVLTYVDPYGISATSDPFTATIALNYSDLTVEVLNPDDLVYTGGKIEPRIEVRNQSDEVVDPSYYIVQYTNNVNAAEASASNPPTVSVIGNKEPYNARGGKATFTIQKADQVLTYTDKVTEAEGQKKLFLTYGDTVSIGPTRKFTEQEISSSLIGNAVGDGYENGQYTAKHGGHSDSNPDAAQIQFSLNETANIKALTESVHVYASSAVPRLSFEKAQISVPANGAVTNTLNFTPALEGDTIQGKLGALTYESSDPTVAAVDNAGTVTLTGKGGTVTITAKTAPSSEAQNYAYTEGQASYTVYVADGTIQHTAENYTGTYDGEPHGITLNVTKPTSGATIEYSEDDTTYSITSVTYTDAGSHIVYYRIKADGYATFNGTATVTIHKAEIIDFTQPANVTYNGTAYEPEVVGITVRDGKGKAPYGKGTDYTVAYANNTNAGTATVTLTGIGNYTGTVTKTFTIAQKDLGGNDIMVSSIEDQQWTGQAIRPDVTVTDTSRSTELTRDVDYTVAYTNNISPGTATVTMTGRGNYTGTRTMTFEIVDNAMMKVLVDGTTLTYNGNAQFPELAVTYDSVALKRDVDYTVGLSGDCGTNCVNGHVHAGTHTFTITPKDPYPTAVITKTFTIEKAGKTVAFADITDGSKTIVSGEATEYTAAATLTTDVATTGETLSYESSNRNVATVDNTGKVTIVGPGTAVITATSPETENFKAASASYTLNVLARVTLDPNGGTGSMQTLTGLPDEVVGYQTPTRDGYFFVGWSESAQPGSAGSYVLTFTKELDGKTLYAVWERKSEGTTYTITLDPGQLGTIPGGTMYLITNANGTLEGLTIPDAVPNDSTRYEFSGWFTAEGEKLTTSTVFTADATVTARWKNKQPSTPAGTPPFTIFFEANGGVTEILSMTTDDQGRLSELPTPTREKHTFEGWFTLPSGGTSVTTGTTFTSDTTLYAHWKLESSGSDPEPGQEGFSATVTFDPNGGTLTGEATATTDQDGKLTQDAIPTAAKPGMTFEGWFTEKTSGTQITTESVFRNDTTVYAHWSVNPASKYYTITFDPNGGTLTGEATATTEDATGKLTALPAAPTREGWTFTGWFTEKTGGTEITTESVFGGDTTVYAQWTRNEGTAVIITFDPNGGTLTGEATRSANAEGKLDSLPVPTREKHVWTGWYTMAEGGAQITKATVFTEDMTVYAHWATGQDPVVVDPDPVIPDPSQPGTSSGVIVLPGEDGELGTGDDVTVKPGDDKVTVDETTGKVTIPEGSTVVITKPDGSTTTVTGPASVDSDGTITVNQGGSADTNGDNTPDVTGPAVITPEGEVKTETDPKPESGIISITLPGKDGVIGTGDDVVVKPGDDKVTVDENTGKVTIPEGSTADVILPGGGTITVTGPASVDSDGTITVNRGGSADTDGDKDPEVRPGTDEPVIISPDPVEKEDNTIVLPGEDGVTGTEDDVTVTPAQGSTINADGSVTLPESGGTVKKPGGSTITTDGPATVNPDGSVELPQGVKADTDGDGRPDVTGPAVITPEGQVKQETGPETDETTGDITLPGKDGVTGTGDDVVVKPGNSGAAWDPATGKVNVPDGETVTVVLPGDKQITVTGPAAIEPDGTITVNRGGSADTNGDSEPEVQPGTDEPVIVSPDPVEKEDGTIVLPGEDGVTGTGDDVTVKPGEGSNVTVDDRTGKVTIPEGSTAEITKPGGGTTTVTGPASVDSDGTITVNQGGSADTNGDGAPDVTGPAVITPEGEVKTETGPVIEEGTTSITLPGKDGVTGTGDDVVVKPGNSGATWDPATGKVNVPDGETVTVVLPDGKEITVTGPAAIEPDGTITVNQGGSADTDGDNTPDVTGPEVISPDPVEKEDGTIVLPGKDGMTGTEDDVTVTPGAGGGVTVDETTGKVTIPEGSTTVITKPDGSTTTVTGPASVDSDGTITVNQGGTTVITKPDGGTTTVTGPAVITPEGQVEKKYYTITLKYCDGTTPDETLQSSDLSKLTETPTWGNAVFLGWFTEEVGGVQATADTRFDGDTTLYARWSKTDLAFTITLDANGGTLTGAATMETNAEGKLDSLPAAPTYTDHTFDGWYTAPEGGVNVTTDTVFTAAATIYAHWTRTGSTDPQEKVYTITFNPNGGTLAGGVATMQTNTEGKLDTLPADPTPPDGYTFDGWYTATVNGQKITTETVFGGNMTVYAVWSGQPPVTLPPYTITLDPNGRSLGALSPTLTTDAEGKLAALPTLPDTTFDTFGGWYTDPTSGVEVKAGAIFTADTTIYAHWYTAYTVTFDLAGGTLVSGNTEIRTNAFGKLPEKFPEVKREGYVFGGWFADGIEVDANTVFDKNTTVMATWTKDPDAAKKFTITFDAVGGTISGGAAMQTGTDGRLVSLPTATRGSHKFDGWFHNGTQVTTETVFTSDATVYAKWTGTGTSGGGGGGGGGGIGSIIVYPVTVEETEHGRVTVTPLEPEKRERVEIRPAPDAGYEVSEVTVTTPTGFKVTVREENGVWSFIQPGNAVTVKVSFREKEKGSYADCTHGGDCPIPEFRDTDPTAWYHDGIHYCLDEGLMVGYEDGTFRPEADTSRAMVVTILWRLEGSPVVNYALTFEDVAPNGWYAESIRWAVSEGIVTGYSDSEFGPEDSITREQMAAILYRYCKYKGVSGNASADLSGYTDATDVSGWAASALRWATGSGLMKGTENGLLIPLESASRAQTATLLLRLCESVGKQ